MAAPIYPRLLRPQLGLQRLLVDLRPPLNRCRCPHRVHFSSTPIPAARRRERNKNRGVSAIRSTGLRPRQTIPVTVDDLPVPVPRDELPPLEVDPDHGLWGFFSPAARTAGRPLRTAEEIGEHGRSWTVEELRGKSWEDLHALWWVCVRERNIISTENTERARLKAGYGDWEAEKRDNTIKRTQRAIKHALTERYYAWQEAQQEALHDPEVNLDPGPGESAFTPGTAYEQQVFETDDPSQPGDGELYAEGKAVSESGKEVDVEVRVKELPYTAPEVQQGPQRP